MSQTEKKVKGRMKKRLCIGLFVFISIYFLISLITIMFSHSDDTILPDTGVIYSKTSGQGIVIKEEYVYYSEGSGQLNLLIDEGIRVPAGTEVANIVMVKDEASINNEIKNVEDKINKLLDTNAKSIIKNINSEEKLDNINSIIEGIQTNIKNENYEAVGGNINNLSNLSNGLIPEETLINQSLEALYQEKERLVGQLNSNFIRYFSKEPGIVSYEVDGYENVYLPKEFENYTYEKLTINDMKDKDENKSLDVSSGQPIFKIINNFEWYMAIKIEDITDIKLYETGQTMLIELDNGTELKGKIIAINITGDKAVIVLKLNTYIHQDYNLRFPLLNIVHYKKEGLKIPTKVIIEKDGKKGVLIKDINGIVVFKQISVLGEEDEYSIIDKGNNNGYIEENGKSYKTVTLYDEIFVDPLAVSEGEILR
ncbi:HlyD family efflux transporter periplasmic adaptor subunit [Tissierella sp. Yu-01]|uniref:HlyD family efflux transporter periplasmic adaptor subunit n=1 Tax=Tissierella sp. Yu-01 TaxID=3035694 RepID=UPI00240D5F30|nr:HlyD family efflux transporter periplasmic adaptor subunit [Tissierella sp. Yu-01]WFA09832.1 HlyD family efflux transporter periplasmic adaptor subunit [Tissierella sp. Yu-01]